ncbi:hypothetical protein [Flavobacterium faecale]|uniref:hypothetical protein n=1 Tax=Flavobacterium faecale TaxID=1355330 RepID=UPI003AACEBA2
MKRVILILCMTLFFACKSKKVVNTKIPIETTQGNEEMNEVNEENNEDEKEKSEFVKLMTTAVDYSKRRKAYELGKRMLMTCNTSKFKPYNTSEATTSVINNITIEKLSTICTRYRQYYGTFIDLKLIEIHKNTKTGNSIYRYKALYSKPVANKELRVTMNAENKISAIKTLDWVNAF